MSENNNRINSYSRIVFENFKQSQQLYFKRLAFNFDRRLGFPFLKNPNAYEDLTPKIIEDKTYINAINWALQNKDINNIALTGAYGSGKSSVLKTLKETYKQYNYVNISLATFEDLEKGPELNKRIELSILQQLLYLEKSKNIPNSRFKKIKNFKNYNLILSTLIWFFVGLSFIFIFQQDYLNKIGVFKNINTYFSIIEIFALIILTAGILFILRNFLKSVSNFKFDKITSKGDFELNREDKETSILNKNLDEIIYFFEKTKYNVVIIEDLDRFKEPEIFTKLREINLLLNNSKQVNRHITFIYALIDSMFKDGNRTKFFDFFVPIIPVINSSNSYEKLRDRLDFENISDGLLYDVSLYIEDMRLLINIVNEYKIYREKLLGNINLNENKLFAFVVYKNKFPEDFAELSDNKGFVYRVFNEDIRKLKLNVINDLNVKVEKANLKIRELKNVRIENIDNLRKLYLIELFKELPNEKDVKIKLSTSLSINDIENLVLKENFDEIINNGQVNYTFSQYVPYNGRFETIEKTIDISVVEKRVKEGYTYKQLEILITEAEENEIDEYKLEISKLKKQADTVKAFSLQELITFSNSINGLNDEIKGQSILIYFLRNGFISEDYFDYISIFYEGSITKNDKNFILSIRDKNPLDFNYKLEKIEGVFKHIKNDFGKPEILNINLLDYLFENQNVAFYQQLFNQYSHESNSRLVHFAEEYITHGKHTDNFFKMICYYWEGFWNYVHEHNSFSREIKDNILVNLINNADATDLIKQNKDRLLTDYISKKRDFFLEFQDGNKKVEEILLILKVKFVTALDQKTSSHFFQYIYDNDLYEFRMEIVKQLIKEVENIEESEVLKLDTSNFTTLVFNNCENIIRYIENEDNINYYVKNIFLASETNIEENETTVLKLLNDKNLTDDIKASIIFKEKAKIEKLEMVKDNSLWEVLIVHNRIQANWSNIYNYYLLGGITESLIKFLNNDENAVQLSKIKIFPNIDGEDSEKHSFIKDLLTTDEIVEESYNSLCKSILHVYPKLNYEKINDYKIQKIIENNIIKFSLENFNLLKQSSTNGHIILIEQNFDKYLEIRDDFVFEVNDYKLLLTSATLTEDNLIELIGELEEEDLKSENNLPEVLSELFVKFKQIELQYTFLRKTLQNTKNGASKIIIFNKYFQLFSGDTDKVDEILLLLGYPYSQLPMKWKKLNFIKNQNNFEFISKLESINYYNISSVNENGEIIKIFTKRK